MTDIVLPWPSSLLAGHAKGHWRSKHHITAKHREWAYAATLAARPGPMPETGDIRVIAAFYPPHQRGDRVNYPAMLKPLWDGIADALEINDRRFLPSYVFGECEKGGRIVISILGEE